MKLTKLLISTILMAGIGRAAFAFEALPAKPPIPADNKITKDKIELGKMLYFDPRLSVSGTVSCNSCHNLMSGGDDSRPVSIGVEGKRGGRSAPTVWNSAFLSVQFWDGRAPSLEEQAKGPIANPVEMGATHELVVKRISQIPEYVELFKRVFGKDDVTIDNAVITHNSPFDRYLKGNKKALTAQQVKGMKLFESTGCVSCHSGPNFSGPLLPQGTGFFMKFPTFPGSIYEKKYKLTEDMGRYTVTKNEADKHMWRVPTLRNVALTAPYFHNGSVKTLHEAVKVMAKVQLNKDLSDSDADDIVSFLKSLTGQFPVQTMPRLPATPGESLVGDQK